MIIKVTVNDNDFSGVLGCFMDNFYSNVVYPDFPKNAASDEIQKMIVNTNIVRALINPNSDTEWNEDNRARVIEAVTEAFKNYVKGEPESDREYLMENFDVEIIDSLTDEWQNGENFYWFQHADAVINL